jgi:telomeric repeat-binding factor 2
MYETKLTVGQEKLHEILSKLEESSSHVKLVSTPEVRKVVDALQTSCADLHRSVEDPLPAAKAAADEVLAARMEKETNRNGAGVNGWQTTCSTAGPSSVNNIDRAPNKGAFSLMDRNPTAQTYQVCVCFPFITLAVVLFPLKIVHTLSTLII